MSLHQGESYRCPMPGCGCEITVTRGAGPSGGDQPPTCCCGTQMQRA